MPAPPPPVTGHVFAPLANGNGDVALAWETDKGERAAGLTNADRRFDRAGGLQSLDMAGSSTRMLFDKGRTVDADADGTVAWGRWIAGDSKVEVHAGGNDGDDDDDGEGIGEGRLATLHYIAFAGRPSLPAIGHYRSFASTAPTVTARGQTVFTGMRDSATGSVAVAFLTAAGGSAAYHLSVPVGAETFTLSGVARQTSSFGFSGRSAIASTGSGCRGGCTGSLGGGASVLGLVGGRQNARVGMLYGFDSRLGNVSGAIVFRP